MTLKPAGSHEHDYTIASLLLLSSGARSCDILTAPLPLSAMLSPLIHTLSRWGASFPLTPASCREGAAATLGHHSNPPTPILGKATVTCTVSVSDPQHDQSQLLTPAGSTFKNEQLSGLKVPHPPPPE